MISASTWQRKFVTSCYSCILSNLKVLTTMKTLNFPLLTTSIIHLTNLNLVLCPKSCSHLFPPLSSRHQKDKTPQHKMPKSQPCKRSRWNIKRQGNRWEQMDGDLDPIKLSIKLSLLGAVTIDLFQTVLRSFYTQDIAVLSLGKEGWDRETSTRGPFGEQSFGKFRP